MAENDIGVRAVEELFERLLVDEKWAVREPRGFTWWGYRLAQHVQAGLPSRDGELEVCEVRVWTDVANEVDDSRDPAAIMGIANQQQTLNALVWDQVDQTVVECCTVVVTSENIGWLIELLTTAAVLQNAAAHSRAHAVAEAVGGLPAASNHPRNGERPEMDAVLDVPAAVIAPAGEDESAFVGPLTEGLQAFAEQVGFFGFADAERFTCEVPFTGSRPSALVMQTNELPETSLVRVLPNTRHPLFGFGALLTMSIPLSFEKEDVPSIANELNRMESTGDEDTVLLGAWCPDPTSDEGDGLAFNAFVPNVLARPGILENLVIYQAVRSRLAALVLADDVPPLEEPAEVEQLYECRPSWIHREQCGPTEAPGLCACGCVEGERWCLEHERCNEPGCGHQMIYHLDGSCWSIDDCVCTRSGRMSLSPDGYLADFDMNAMISDW